MTEAKCSECDRLIEELNSIRTSAGELEDLLYKRLTELRDEVRELKAENENLEKEIKDRKDTNKDEINYRNELIAANEDLKAENEDLEGDLADLRAENSKHVAYNSHLKADNEEFKAAEELRIRQQVWWR